MPYVPDAPVAPPAHGTTRIVLDANGERARVTETLEKTSIYGTSYSTSAAAFSGTSFTTKPLCLTPCVVDLTPGMHALNFQSSSDPQRVGSADVQVGERRKVVRHAMGRVDKGASWHHLLASSAALLGIGAIVGGALTLPFDHKEFEDHRRAGKVMLLAGGATLAVSIPFMIITRPTWQEGATTEFIPNDN
jgi:hypothetical protein